MSDEEKHGFSPHSREELYNLLTFLKDIDWTEPWLIALLAFHASVTMLTLVTRNHGNFQAAFFFLLLLLVFCSETLNELAAKHWRYFARHQYFDSSGMFMSIVFSAPLLLNCLVMVGQWLWTSGNLMIKLKQAQLRHQMRAENSRRHKTSLGESSSSREKVE